jgi:hypothetical protein
MLGIILIICFILQVLGLCAVISLSFFPLFSTPLWILAGISGLAAIISTLLRIEGDESFAGGAMHVITIISGIGLIILCCLSIL